ncbi:hypothetical protein, partial [Bartonella apihabitans]|uniref:hypothetical protein n=1 Tax=Bartonella apihabitans TaxID=2750929 RepID=UPI001AEE05F3
RAQLTVASGVPPSLWRSYRPHFLPESTAISKKIQFFFLFFGDSIFACVNSQLHRKNSRKGTEFWLRVIMKMKFDCSRRAFSRTKIPENFVFFIKTESFWQNQRVIPKNHLVTSTNQPDRNEIPSGFWCEMRKSFYIGYRHSGIDFENPADET